MEPGLELFLFQEEGIRFASERDSRAALASASLRTCAVRVRFPASFWCIWMQPNGKIASRSPVSLLRAKALELSA